MCSVQFSVAIADWQSVENTALGCRHCPGGAITRGGGLGAGFRAQRNVRVTVDKGCMCAGGPGSWKQAVLLCTAFYVTPPSLTKRAVGGDRCSTTGLRAFRKRASSQTHSVAAAAAASHHHPQCMAEFKLQGQSGKARTGVVRRVGGVAGRVWGH